MSRLRAVIKNLFYKTGGTSVLDSFLFRLSYLKNKKRNSAFRRANPHLTIPPDYFLYETYLLDYEQFYKDGEVTAKEIIEWTEPYLRDAPVKILDWGCGLSRIVMHIPELVPRGSLIFGCDINETMIEFGQKNFRNISYSKISYIPPTNFNTCFFDLIYALSVFTHIETSLQSQWIREIHRLMNSGGIFLLTTHGRNFDSKLLSTEKKILEQSGAFTKPYGKKGHRMMSTYNSKESFEKMLQPFFEILEFYDGAEYPSKMGGQDLWIVRKVN